jgi:hypothetical protein
VTTWLSERRRRRADAAVADHDSERAARRDGAPTTKDVAVGGQTGSTVA